MVGERPRVPITTRGAKVAVTPLPTTPLTDYHRRTALLAAVGLTHGTMDATTTVWGITTIGPHIEMNPIVTGAAAVTPAAIPLVMLAGVAVISALTFGIDAWSRRAGDVVLSGAAVAGAAVVLNNLFVLLAFAQA